MSKIDTIIFDLGGVLIDWNPKYVYREVFNGDEEKVDWFLNTVCTNEWNVEHDAGRLLKDGTELLVKQYPQYEEWIRIYYDRWADMLGEPIHETVELLNNLKKANTHKLYALTNWSAETFPVALDRFEFLQQFDGIMVSGVEKVRKPFLKIYKLLLNRYQLKASTCLFIDDNYENVMAAEKVGITGVHFINTPRLSEELINLGIAHH